MGLKDIENKDDIKVGDVVRLKSGGPYMTVNSVDTIAYDMVACKWYDIKNRLQTDLFKIKTLRKEVES